MRYSPTRILGALRRRQKDWLRFVIYRIYRQLPLEQSALMESFQGKVIGDNPLAIFLELQKQPHSLKLYFTVSKTTSAPPGCIAVRHGSLSWIRALATSKLLVNNTNFPGFFRKRTGQNYVQTWHGTPLKRLGKDIVDAVPSKSYLKMMAREASYWDVLISPSRYCSEIFASTFGYRGKILESGYPRNDLLASATDEKLKLALGLDNRPVVLYAPTWRDYKRTALGDWKPVNFLSQGVGEAFQLLFRGHTNTHSAHSGSVATGAIDVTDYENVAELYRIADVLVTDYSSSMFDFSVSGKPIIFLAPDIAEYEAKRGFYFDFRQLAPGPILENPSELEAALENLESQKVEYAQKYRIWQEKFNSLEDGQSAKRVVEYMRSAFHSLFSAP